MTEPISRLSDKAGLPPGTLVHVGEKRTDKVKITIIDFGPDGSSEMICERPEDCLSYKDSKSISWINVDGLHDVELISELGSLFGLNNLLLEDVLNTNLRPMIEEYDDHAFMSLKMLGINEERSEIVSEQLSLVLGKNWVISFQEQEGDVFDIIRKRIRENRGTMRQRGADFLMYRLIDTVVDHYYFVTEYFSEKAEELEERIMTSINLESLQEIQALKKQVVEFRNAVRPLRDAMMVLRNDRSPLVSDETAKFMRDVFEHIIQLTDSIDTQREAMANLMDLYLSGASIKMNQVMQVLTIIATIFIPLTFIAGIYGMNFEHMPELGWKYGYMGVWGIMLATVIGMIFFFKRKNWL